MSFTRWHHFALTMHRFCFSVMPLLWAKVIFISELFGLNVLGSWRSFNSHGIAPYKMTTPS
jgi:hypothetical protein